MSLPLTTQEIADRERVRVTTVRAWIARGVKVHGRRVKLQAERPGRAIRVQPEALVAFKRACSGEVEPVQRETPRQASKRAQDAQERVRQRLRRRKPD